MKQFTPEQIKSILDQVREVDQASIYEGSTDKPQDVQEIVLDLSVERKIENPFIISSPFKNIFVESSLNISDVIYLKPNAPETFQAAFKLDLNSSVEFERSVSKAYLYWPAQAGGKMVLKLSVYSKFKTGKCCH